MTKQPFVYLNGDWLPLDEAKISVLDRGFLFADGIYEYIPVYQGNLFRLDKHLQRLQRSLQAIKLAPLLSMDGIADILREMVRKQGGGNLSIYLQITRGVGTQRSHIYGDQAPPPTVFAMATALNKTPLQSIEEQKGIRAITVEDIRWKRCDIKSIALLPNVMLQQLAYEQQAEEAIMIRDGQVTEGTASNVYMVKSNTILTPPQSQFILGGITRDLIIELAHQHKLPLQETLITEQDLSEADEIWISSSAKELVPVVQLNGKAVANGKAGPIWETMARIYLSYKNGLMG